MINVKNLNLAFGDKVIFEGVSFTVKDGERAGIAGANGVGKTTLLKILLEDARGRGESVGYLAQDARLSEEEIRDTASDKTAGAIFFRNLKIFGADDVDIYGDLDNLSGGERAKLALARAFSVEGGLLLLDEPTNNLDGAGKAALTDICKKFSGTLIAVSHDRDFLNAVCGKIIELENGAARVYDGAYDYYKAEKEKEVLSKTRAYEAGRAEERKIDKQIKELRRRAESADAKVRKQGGNPGDARLALTRDNAKRSAGKLAASASAKVSKLERQRENAPERPFADRPIKYNIAAGAMRSKYIFKAENLCKSFGGKVLFKDLSFTVKTGGRFAVMGANGSGKTTLIKILLGLEPYDSGSVYRSPALRPAYFSQNVSDLNGEMSAAQYAASGDAEYKTDFLTNLANMNMKNDRFNVKIKYLSLGERMKVKLAETVLNDSNLIILDEPTNNLDIPNKEELLRVLANYKGSLILVSHENYFTERIATDGVCLDGWGDF